MKENSNKIKLNIIYNMLYQILILIVPFITIPYVSRILNPEGLGQYSVTTAIAKYFMIFCLLGMNNYGNRMIAKSKDSKKQLSKTFWSLWIFQVCMTLIMFIIFIFYILLLGYDKYSYLIICQIPNILSCFFEISWFYYGMEEFKLMVKRNTFIKVLTMILIFVFIKNKNDVWIYILINSMSVLLSQIILWPKLLRSVSKSKINFHDIKQHLKPNLVLFVSVLAVSVYTLMDKIMIEFLSNTSQVGYYENSEKVFNIAISLIGAIGAVMLPRVSNMIENNNSIKIKEYLDKSLKYIMIFSIFLSFGVLSISNSFSILFFGKNFERCGVLLSFLSPAIVFYSWSNILRTQYLLPREKDSIFVKGTIFAAIVNFFINFLFIKKFGALGAIFGTVFAQFCEASYQTIMIKKELNLIKELKRLIPFVIFGLVSLALPFILSFVIENNIILFILQGITYILIYLSIVLLYFLYTNDEIIYLLKKVRYKNEKIY